MNNRIYLCLAHMSDAGLEKKYIQEAFDTNWVVPLGPNVNAFETDLEAYVDNNRKVVVLSSCTAALHLALLQLGVGKDDEVLCQTFSFCASSNPVTYCGAIPVFIDSEKDTWNMSPVLLEDAIQDRIAKTGNKPKAIIVVDLYGMPADWEAMEDIGKKYNIPIIEDAANAMGSFYKGRHCGLYGTLATFSFNGNKMITTSGGGALLCDDEETKKHTIFLATQAREAYPYYQHEAVGYNYRMSNICAGIGRGQMTVVEQHVAHHKHIQKMYEDAFENVDGIEVHKAPDARYDSNFWLCTILLNEGLRMKNEELAYANTVNGAVGGVGGIVHGGGGIHTGCEPNANVEAMRLWLDQCGIEARPLWKPMHCQPVYSGSPAYVNGVSESLFRRGLCLPSGPMVSDNDIRYIINCIKENML